MKSSGKAINGLRTDCSVHCQNVNDDEVVSPSRKKQDAGHAGRTGSRSSVGILGSTGKGVKDRGVIRIEGILLHPRRPGRGARSLAAASRLPVLLLAHLRAQGFRAERRLHHATPPRQETTDKRRNFTGITSTAPDQTSSMVSYRAKGINKFTSVNLRLPDGNREMGFFL